MKAQLKLFFSKNKKFILFSIGFFFVFLILLLPYDDGIQKGLIELTKTSPVRVQYESSFAGLFPPKIALDEVVVESSVFSSPMISQKIIIKPFYQALLALKLGVKARIHFKDNFLDLALSRSSSKKRDTLRMKGQSEHLPFDSLKFLSPFFSGAKGGLQFSSRLNMDLNYSDQPEGEVIFSAKNVRFNPSSFTKKYIGTVRLPLLKWQSLSGKLQTKKGRLQIENIVMGEKKTDPLYLRLDGFANINWGRYGPELKNYDLKLELEVDKKTKAELFFIDLFLSQIEEKTDKERLRYRAQVTGQSFYPPKIQKLSQ